MERFDHVNLSDHATDEANLYEIWRMDYSKQVTKEAWRTIPGFLLLSAVSVGFVDRGWLIFAVFLLYSGLRCFVDASNVNYMLHRYEFENALTEFRRRARKSLSD